jgi:hypothetical protein
MIGKWFLAFQNLFSVRITWRTAQFTCIQVSIYVVQQSQKLTSPQLTKMNSVRGDNDPKLKELGDSAEMIAIVKAGPEYTDLEPLANPYTISEAIQKGPQQKILDHLTEQKVDDFAPTFVFLAYIYRRNSGWNDLNLAYELFAGHGDLQLKTAGSNLQLVQR